MIASDLFDISSFEKLFQTLTGHSKPHQWQAKIAKRDECRNAVVRIPTGLGKTEGILCAWMWNRLVHNGGNVKWPRRLVWCLPMRVLVNQTADIAKALAEKLPISDELKPKVHILMGGEDAAEWCLDIEEPAILVGTLDMLLSRALNRGYACPRGRWPREFSLLHQDSLWVMDEIQLMGVGLATSAQLQAYRDADSEKAFKPSYTWWMSATLQESWLESVDTTEYAPTWTKDPINIADSDRNGGPWESQKPVEVVKIGLDKDADSALTARIVDEHRDLPSSKTGRITLVIANTVDRAKLIYKGLRSCEEDMGRTEIRLIHSRFRSPERAGWTGFLRKDACNSNADRIIVATQVVEAGVDISASCLITEMAPWPNLVQRFGRCGRYGDDGRIIVVDRELEGKAALPYTDDELVAAGDLLSKLEDVGLKSLEDVEKTLKKEQCAALYPYQPQHLLLQREFRELFDTSLDLAGVDMDIGRFIREGDDRDINVFWRSEDPNQDSPRPEKDEICTVPFLKVRKWLFEGRHKGEKVSWVWDWLDGKWVDARKESVLPGRLLWVRDTVGGYSKTLGFEASSKETVPSISNSHKLSESSSVQSDTRHDSENLSQESWQSIAFHGLKVAEEARKICTVLDMPERLTSILFLAGQCHDIGKSHPAFQGCIRGPNRPARQDIAKAPDEYWPERSGDNARGYYRYADDSDHRPGFRHELASTLALFSILKRWRPYHDALLGPWREIFLAISPQKLPEEVDTGVPSGLEAKIVSLSAEEFNILAYLVAAHHGKVRMSLDVGPKDMGYRSGDAPSSHTIRGIRGEDDLPSIRLAIDEPESEHLTLSLEPASLGLSPDTGASWRERSEELLERFGPGALGFLETILRTADIRATRLAVPDPDCVPEAQV